MFSSEVPDISCRPMMDKFLLYSAGVLFSGIYDDRLLVKIVSENKQYDILESIPYDGAKAMYLVEDADDKNTYSALCGCGLVSGTP